MDPRTFSILIKLVDLGASPFDIARVAEITGGSADEETVYEALRKINPEVAEAFRREMSLYVWRSDIRKEPFRKDRIVKSLVKETGIPKSLAEKIAKEVEERIRESDLSFITSSLIRELALIKLIEYGLEDAYKKYSRLGIPVYDLLVMVKHGKERLHERLAGKILQQYTIQYLLPKTLVESLFEGFVEIGGLPNPFVPFAQTYYTRVSDSERWFEGLMRYLLNREFVDVPSIFVPDFLEEEHIAVLKSIKKASGAILWSTEKFDGVIVSETPVYSFGSVPEKKVLDYVVVNVERLFLKEREYLSKLEDIADSLAEYQERRKEFVKAGNLYVRLEGLATLSESDRRKISEVFEGFPLL